MILDIRQHKNDGRIFCKAYYPDEMEDRAEDDDTSKIILAIKFVPENWYWSEEKKGWQHPRIGDSVFVNERAIAEKAFFTWMEQLSLGDTKEENIRNAKLIIEDLKEEIKAKQEDEQFFILEENPIDE